MGDVFRGVFARSFRGARLLGRAPAALCAALIALTACDDATRVRLSFAVENPAFRPEFIEIYWGPIDGEQRMARVPGSGSLPANGNAELGSALITLSGERPLERRFIARGWRGTDTRVSGAVAFVPWSRGKETPVRMTLGCYSDPDPAYGEPVPGCPRNNGDGGLPDAAPVDAGGEDAADAGRDGNGDGNDDGNDAASADTGDAPADLGGDRPRG